MAGNCFLWLKMSANGRKGLEIVGNTLKWLEIAGNRWTRLEITWLGCLSMCWESREVAWRHCQCTVQDWAQLWVCVKKRAGGLAMLWLQQARATEQTVGGTPNGKRLNRPRGRFSENCVNAIVIYFPLRIPKSARGGSHVWDVFLITLVSTHT